MAPRHAKSPCCDAPVRRFGGRRRQCAHCKGTWSIRKKRTGRKRTRNTTALAKRILLDGHTLSHERRHFGTLSVPGIAARFAVAVRLLAARSSQVLPHGPYALIVDGVYFRFARREWVLYILAVKPVHDHRMYFLDPVLLRGRERYEAWCEAVDIIPSHVKNHIRALVPDGLRGFQRLANQYSWTHQRCHFHLLASLVRGKGKRRYATRGSATRDAVLMAVRTMLADTPKRERDRARRAISLHVDGPTCPAYIRKHIVEFLEREQDFRTYLRCHRLNLPTTTNAVESTGRLVRKATRTARTPESLLLRAIALLRLKSFVVCNGASHTQN